MYKEELGSMAHSAEKKVKMINGSLGKYGVSCILGGIYVAFGTMLAYGVGAMLQGGGSHSYKIGMGLSFGIALCLVIFAGADLFTSNTMTLAVGGLEKKTTWQDGVKICTFCWFGNLVGSLIASFLFVQGGLVSEEAGAFIVKMVEGKIGLTPSEMLIRGILCNLLVCLATWCTYRMKNEAAKVMMVLWCVYAFFTAGYEHSIANMSLFGIAYMIPQGAGLAMSGAITNLLIVTIGNIIGGAVILGIGYSYMSKENN